MFFFPLFDNNPTRQRPYLSWLIMAICLTVFAWQQSLNNVFGQLAVLQLGFIPANLLGSAILPAELALIPAWMTIFTSMFLHGGWMHIGSNMLYLWIFGDNVEESMGRLRFLLFYAACGTAAAMAQAAIDPSSRIPMIGASGGIAGILGAYLVLHPKAAIRTFVLILIFVRFINLPAWIVLGIWIGSQFVAVPKALAGGGGVAYIAHIGGFVAGMALVPFFKRREIPLFGKNDNSSQRWAAEPMSFAQIKDEARRKYRKPAYQSALGSRLGPRHAAHTSDTHEQNDRRPPEKTRGSVPSTKRRKPKSKPPHTPGSPWD